MRNRTGQIRPENYFGEERDRLRQGYCDLQWSPNRLLQSLKNSMDFYIPGGDADIVAIREWTRDAFYPQFAQGLSGQRPLLYVHGYNIGFEKACLRARHFQENLGLAGRFLLFSWPSDGHILNYPRDEADISWSIPALEQVIRELMRAYPDGIDLVAHSMGNRGLVMALDRVAAQWQARPGQAKPVHNLVLIAADMDAAIASQYLPRLSLLAHRITLYVSDNDRALIASRTLHGYPRLGEAGTHLPVLSGVEVIDVSQLSLERISGHLYHLANRYVINDLQQLLQQDLGATQRPHLQPDTQTGHYRLLEMPPSSAGSAM
ncbi:MAG: alpha/beta hydrolase [Thiolinea sp.]